MTEQQVPRARFEELKATKCIDRDLDQHEVGEIIVYAEQQEQRAEEAERRASNLTLIKQYMCDEIAKIAESSPATPSQAIDHVRGLRMMADLFYEQKPKLSEAEAERDAALGRADADLHTARTDARISVAEAMRLAAVVAQVREYATDGYGCSASGLLKILDAAAPEELPTYGELVAKTRRILGLKPGEGVGLDDGDLTAAAAPEGEKE